MVARTSREAIEMKIEIREQKIQNINGTSNKTGKAFSMNKQEGWLHTANQPYPIRIEITLDDHATNGFLPGMYELMEESFYVNRFGQLQVGTLKLRDLKQLQKSAA